MLTRHFFKTLLVFTMLIVLGLVGIFAVNYIEQAKTPDQTAKDKPCKVDILC